MLKRSTIQLLRFPFSFFLMPVFWFALSCVSEINIAKTVLIFIIIHLFLYPSSNGYNSFMDRDETSIGGLAKPLQPTKQLLYVTIIMDVIALLLSLLISPLFSAGLLFYIICSRLYSYRAIRLKRFAVLGFIIVIINQGALIFMLAFSGCGQSSLQNIPLAAVASAAFLIGGFYPLTQIYQHDADRKDGVRTISMMLGKRGTFIFCAAMYGIAFVLLYIYYASQNMQLHFLYIQLFFIPVILYFGKWFYEVYKDENKADFKHTMKMNLIASAFASISFITLIIMKQFV